MIDIFNIVFTKLYTDINANFEDVDVKDEYIDESAHFPCVTVTQDSNVDYQKMMIHNWSNFQKVLITVNIYTNSSTKKTDAKKILQRVDYMMHTMKFTCTHCSNTPNVDRSIYRITARYEAIVGIKEVDGSGNFYHQIYRS